MVNIEAFDMILGRPVLLEVVSCWQTSC